MYVYITDIRTLKKYTSGVDICMYMKEYACICMYIAVSNIHALNQQPGSSYMYVYVCICMYTYVYDVFACIVYVYACISSNCTLGHGNRCQDP